MRAVSRFTTAGVALAGLALAGVAIASPALAADPSDSNATFSGTGRTAADSWANATDNMNEAVDAGEWVSCTEVSHKTSIVFAMPRPFYRTTIQAQCEAPDSSDPIESNATFSGTGQTSADSWANATDNMNEAVDAGEWASCTEVSHKTKVLFAMPRAIFQTTIEAQCQPAE